MNFRAPLAATILVFAGRALAGQAATDEPINLNADLFLTPPQRTALAIEAMRGSSDAATKIALFYGFVALDPVEEHRWVVIAAENGDPVAQYNAYQDFMNYGTELDKERAMFWLKKSAGAGDKYAQEALKDIEKERAHPAHPTPAR